MESSKRPLFSNLVQTISNSLEEMAGYLHIGAFADLNEVNAYTTVETEHETSTGEAEHKF